MTYPKVKRSHIVSRTYLRNFAENDMIAMRLGSSGQARTIHIDDAAVRKAFYRRTRPDGTEIDDIEWSMSHLEGSVTPLLRGIESRWPLSNEDKATLAEFVALQILRSPRWREWHNNALRNEIADLRHTRGASMNLPRPATDAEIARFEAASGTATARLTKMLELLPKVASIAAGMHWSLVRFDAPLLVTSDHPVDVWPLERGEACAPEPTRMSAGLLPTLEVRLPLSPHLALLMTWVDDPDTVQPHRGRKHHAKSLNAFTVAQADKQWFHRPGVSPPLTTGGRLLALSPQFFHGYGVQVAWNSRLRAEVSRRIQPRIGSDLRDRAIDMVRITRSPVAG